MWRNSRKRHEEWHWIRYICVLCLNCGHEILDDRPERLWDHVLEDHLHGPDVEQLKTSLTAFIGRWCALACMTCGMSIALQQKASANKKAVLATAKESLTRHHAWHLTEDTPSREGWASRVALNLLLLRVPFAQLWADLLKRYGLKHVDAIAGLSEGCAQQWVGKLDQEIVPNDVLEQLPWLLYAGIVDYDPVIAEAIERPLLAHLQIDEYMPQHEVSGAMNAFAGPSNAQHQPYSSAAASLNAGTMTLSSMSQADDATTALDEDLDTAPTDPDIGADRQPEDSVVFNDYNTEVSFLAQEDIDMLMDHVGGSAEIPPGAFDEDDTELLD